MKKPKYKIVSFGKVAEFEIETGSKMQVNRIIKWLSKYGREQKTTIIHL